MANIAFENTLVSILIKYVMNGNNISVIKSESPDFILEIGKGETIGIEVTQSMLSNQGRLREITKRCFNRSLTTYEIIKIVKADKKLNSFLVNNGSIMNSGKQTAMSDGIGLVDTKCYVAELLSQIDKKQRKLNSNYKLYKHNFLLIKADGPILSNENEWEDFISRLNKINHGNRYKHLFDHIYIFKSNVFYELIYEDKYHLHQSWEIDGNMKNGML